MRVATYIEIWRCLECGRQRVARSPIYFEGQEPRTLLSCIGGGAPHEDTEYWTQHERIFTTDAIAATQGEA